MHESPADAEMEIKPLFILSAYIDSAKKTDAFVDDEDFPMNTSEPMREKKYFCPSCTEASNVLILDTIATKSVENNDHTHS